jgi:hypothetical protein
LEPSAAAFTAAAAGDRCVAPLSNSSSSGIENSSLGKGMGGGVVNEEFELLEMPNAEVYGRLVLCKSMVRDHFIPSYLKALDSVLAQLQEAAARE